MLAEIQFIFDFIVQNFIRIWPYLLITIPIAVAVQLSGASAYIRRALSSKPHIAILMATLVGAFSPFCSCTVIPIVAALLIGGVPLAPVMSFWIASPSMDPEIFFLSVAMVGWEIAVWRLIAALVLSFGAGYITQLAMNQRWLGDRILREQGTADSSPFSVVGDWISTAQARSVAWFQQLAQPIYRFSFAGTATAPFGEFGSGQATRIPQREPETSGLESTSCCAPKVVEATSSCGTSCSTAATEETSGCGTSCSSEPEKTFREKLLKETWAASSLVIRFMLLAFLLEAVIIRYVPEAWITGLLGAENAFAIPLAALIGVPVYTSNIAALPMVGGLIEQGMNPAAGLAFLIAGPTTTLPAMAAVWQLATRRVFLLYVAFSLVGAVLIGLVFQLVSLWS